jgi:predicted nucleotidyltransferase
VPADPRLVAEIRSLPYPAVYATICGDTLYGIDRTDDELDIRGCHAIPAREIVGLRAPSDSIAGSVHSDGLEFELCSHDIKKVCLMLLKKNGCVIEQILSPHIVFTTPEHDELRDIAPHCVARHMAHHYQSQARLQWEIADRSPRGLLYSFRLLLTGIHLMRTGELIPDLPGLRDALKAGWLDDIDPSAPRDDHRSRYESLVEEMSLTTRTSPLPATPPHDARERLNDLLVRVRLA